MKVKKLISVILASAMCCSLCMGAMAYGTYDGGREIVRGSDGKVYIPRDEEGCSSTVVSSDDGELEHGVSKVMSDSEVEEMLQVINNLPEDFQDEVGCSSEVVSIEADETKYEYSNFIDGSARSTEVPKDFHNIAKDGRYEGSFSNLRGTIYTNVYFDMSNNEYYNRVRCYGEYPSLKYTVGNYCITCKKVISTLPDDVVTPVDVWTLGDWISVHHTVKSTHAGHFVCPFVSNTSGLVNDQLYAIGGEIWVNYTDSWK